MPHIIPSPQSMLPCCEVICKAQKLSKKTASTRQGICHGQQGNLQSAAHEAFCLYPWLSGARIMKDTQHGSQRMRLPSRLRLMSPGLEELLQMFAMPMPKLRPMHLLCVLPTGGSQAVVHLGQSLPMAARVARASGASGASGASVCRILHRPHVKMDRFGLWWRERGRAQQVITGTRLRPLNQCSKRTRI